MPTTAPRRPRARLRKSLSVLAITGLAATGASALALTGVASPATAATAAADAPANTCPPSGEMPPLGHLPVFTDSSVAVFAGGDYRVEGAAAESEGLLLVAGDATFAKTSGGVFNIGSAGYGSGITPAGGSQMLAIGGDLSTANGTQLHVGANLAGGGLVDVGGSITPGVTFDLFGGAARDGLGASTAMSPNAGFATVLGDASDDLAGLAATDVATTSGNEVRFASSADRELYVFTVSASVLGSTPEVVFDLASDSAPVLINVTGSSLTWAPNYFADGGSRFDGPSSPEFGTWSSRLAWNVADATTLSLGTNGQLIGSVLAPEADADVTTSTNGRLLVGGDLTIGGDGVEHHNYPWIGGKGLDCTPEPGEPTDPVDPTDPTTPLTPIEPTDPIDPADPTDPVDPTEPVDPSEPTDPTTPEGGDETTVQTPDETPTTTPAATTAGSTEAGLASTGFDVLPLAIGAGALLAAAGVTLVIARRRKA
ncbi:choice-of-anchor A family protein [Agromyces sp. Leaf222]|uniref:choice-of-anchor A family protein n=1 Tax=Agromyces sp. Leaf222 TaxID=1735688 RepID=UPI0006FDCC79|nr:choice-of-anchor A family protein [Agromyces sp. Leaf222]KQM81342.1 hypothetical protein ASE68_16285 [Agromyces sp. Leaf222]